MSKISVKNVNVFLFKKTLEDTSKNNIKKIYINANKFLNFLSNSDVFRLFYLKVIIFTAKISIRLRFSSIYSKSDYENANAHEFNKQNSNSYDLF